MSEHTPGPWEAEPEGGRGAWIAGSNGEWAALACGLSDQNAKANARLIAAAPELLEACKEIIRTGLEGECMHGDQREAIAMVKEAISKATNPQHKAKEKE